MFWKHVSERDFSPALEMLGESAAYDYFLLHL